MDAVLIEVIKNLPLHAILMIGIIVLWRENRRLIAKLEGVAEKQVLHTNMLQLQNTEISQIRAQTNGFGEQHLPIRADSSDV